jgi:hypothetical protein
VRKARSGKQIGERRTQLLDIDRLVENPIHTQMIRLAANVVIQIRGDEYTAGPALSPPKLRQ